MTVLYAALGLAAVFALFHWPVFFGGKVYLNLWIFRDHPPFPPVPSEWLNPLNTGSDFVTHHFAYAAYIADAWKNGFLPLWNPYVFCGMPLYANGSSAVLSPLNVLFLFLEPVRAYQAVWALFFIAGGALLFAVLIKWGMRPWSAFAGGAALVFCPFLMTHIDAGTMLAFVWVLPLVVWTAEATRDAGTTAAAAVKALVLFLAALAGQTQVLIYALMLYLVWEIFAAPPASPAGRRGRPLAHRIGGIVFTLAAFGLLAGFLLLPRAGMLQHSQWAAGPMQGDGGIPLIPWSAIYPAAVHIPRLDSLLHKAVEPLGVSFGLPLGVMPFVMGLAGLSALFIKKTDKRIRIIAALNLVYYVSSLWHTGSYYQVYIFTSAVLFAWVFDEFAKNKRVGRALDGTAWTLLFAVVGPVTALAAALAIIPESFRVRAFELAASRGFLDMLSVHDTERFNELFEWAQRLFSWKSAWIILPVIVMAAILSARRLPRAVLVLVFLGDILFQGAAFRPWPVPAEAAYPRTEAVDFLRKQEGLFRIMAIQPPPKPGEPRTLVLKPNLSVPYQLHDVGGRETALDAAYADFARHFLSGNAPEAGRNSGALDFDNLDTEAASFLNVKYVLAWNGAPLNKEGLEPVWNSDRLLVYKNKRALPRVFFTRRVGMAHDTEEIFHEMTKEASPEPQITVSGRGARETAPLDGAEKAPKAEVAGYRYGNVRVRIENREPGVLVYTDTWDPGWTAADNGRETEILRVNGLFKGVYLEPGSHEVSFEYWPRAFFGGMVISLLTLAALAVFLCFSIRSNS